MVSMTAFILFHQYMRAQAIRTSTATITMTRKGYLALVKAAARDGISSPSSESSLLSKA